MSTKSKVFSFVSCFLLIVLIFYAAAYIYIYKTVDVAFSYEGMEAENSELEWMNDYSEYFNSHSQNLAKCELNIANNSNFSIEKVSIHHASYKSLELIGDSALCESVLDIDSGSAFSRSYYYAVANTATESDIANELNEKSNVITFKVWFLKFALKANFTE